MDYIEIEGYKSIKELKLELKPINILIGSNGVGKSNFISFFKLLNAIFNQRLQRYILEENADDILYFGRKKTEKLFGKLIFGNGEHNNAYHFTLAQTKDGGLFIEKESSGYKVSKDDNNKGYNYSIDVLESNFSQSDNYRNRYLRGYLSSVQVFHFHDTTSTSYLRKECDINDNVYLKQDGRNLPAFLHLLKKKHLKNFIRIEQAIQSIAPYIEKLIVEPSLLNPTEIQLRWVEKNDIDSNFSAYQLSDGTLRFIALATLLLQPNPPKTIIIDEPELGLHPFAINKLAGMIQVASSKSQIIIATQSPGLISYFQPEDVIVTDRSESEKQTVFKRLDPKSLEKWLSEYSLGDLWERNIINAAQPFIK